MKFSVVSICRNNLEGLKKTCESLESQVYRGFQWIIIDGKSTDGTSQWIEKNIGKSADWVSEPDRGIFSAMNKGLDMVKGEHVIFLNGGDIFADKDVLEKVSMEIDRHGPLVDFIYGDSIDITMDGKSFYRKAKDCRKVVRGMFTQHQAMFFRVQSLGNMRFQEKYSYAADYAFVGQLLYKLHFEGEHILKLEFPVCIFLLGGFNEKFRLRTINEDFFIRHDCFHQSFFICAILWVLHFIHLVIKRLIPALPRWVRYEKT